MDESVKLIMAISEAGTAVIAIFFVVAVILAQPEGLSIDLSKFNF